MSTSEHPEEVAPAGSAPRFLASKWLIYHGTGRPLPLHDVRLVDVIPPAPPWRVFGGEPLPHNDEPPEDDGETERRLGSESHFTERDVDPHEVDMVNAALYLRRPLLVTGRPGTGKSALAFRIARELRLGRVLRWSITSQTTLRSGQYLFDAIGRAQEAGMRHAARVAAPGAQDSSELPDEPPIGRFVKLGPLGTAFLPRRLPRVLLIDELDKSEADLPNDLLSIFEDGEFTIPELERVRDRTPNVAVFTDDSPEQATVANGRVRCNAFPMIVITSNGERDFPPAFLRRCLRLETKPMNEDQLAKLVAGHLTDVDGQLRRRFVREFVEQAKVAGDLPADKLLDAMFLATSGAYGDDEEAWLRLRNALWRQLTSLVP